MNLLQPVTDIKFDFKGKNIMFANEVKIDNIVSFITSEVEKNIENDLKNKAIFLQWLDENKNVIIQAISIEQYYEYDIVGSLIEILADLKYYNSSQTYLDVFLKKHFNEKIIASYVVCDKCIRFVYRG